MRNLMKAVLACLLLGMGSTATALVVVEAVDAGHLPGTARVIAGAGDLTTIIGTISDANDVDMYRLRVTGS